jgi:DNA-binding CsgD family transcriptional regulator
VPLIQRIQGAPRLGQQASLVLHISRGRRGERWIRVLKDWFRLFRWPGWSSLPCFKWTPRCAGSRTDGRVRSLSERERRVLRLLQENGPMAASEVARHLGISETHARRLLQGLARRGYVVIHPAPPGGGRGRKTRYSLKTRQDSPEAASGGGKRRKAAPDGVGGHVAGFRTAEERILRSSRPNPP